MSEHLDPTYDEALLTPEEERSIRPDLCHKCGRCCRTAMTGLSHEALLEKANSGDEGSIGFLRVFEPFTSIEEARKVDNEHVERVLAELDATQKLQPDEITFYHCRYVSEHGLCTIYAERPECCRRAPASGWMMMPTDCGYEGWQFLQREKQKESLRRLKEMQQQMAIIASSGTVPDAMQESITRVNQDIAKSVETWKTYGAAHW